jgi:PPOX class probable F420-dependent enzyme
MTTSATLTDRTSAFLLEGTRTGKIGYTASDGRPLITPIWFTVEDGNVFFCTGAGTPKAKAIRRDPRVVLCVDLEEPPYAFVQVQGTAELIDDVAEARRVSTIVGGRYMGADRAEEFGARNGVPGELTVKITPTRVIAELDMTA